MEKEILNKIRNSDQYPVEISEYITEHFDGGFYSEIKKMVIASGQVYYQADISQDNTIYQLRFNAQGKMISHEAVPLQELDEY